MHCLNLQCPGPLVLEAGGLGQPRLASQHVSRVTDVGTRRVPNGDGRGCSHVNSARCLDTRYPGMSGLGDDDADADDSSTDHDGGCQGLANSSDPNPTSLNPGWGSLTDYNI